MRARLLVVLALLAPLGGALPDGSEHGAAPTLELVIERFRGDATITLELWRDDVIVARCASEPTSFTTRCTPAGGEWFRGDGVYTARVEHDTPRATTVARLDVTVERALDAVKVRVLVDSAQRLVVTAERALRGHARLAVVGGPAGARALVLENTGPVPLRVTSDLDGRVSATLSRARGEAFVPVVAPFDPSKIGRGLSVVDVAPGARLALEDPELARDAVGRYRVELTLVPVAPSRSAQVRDVVVAQTVFVVDARGALIVDASPQAPTER